MYHSDSKIQFLRPTRPIQRTSRSFEKSLTEGFGMDVNTKLYQVKQYDVDREVQGIQNLQAVEAISCC